MISEPLTLLNCCPTTDGAAAIVICSKDIARKYSDRPVDLVACVMTSSSYEQAKSISTFSCDVRAATEAYEKSGLGPEDMDFVECHDCFTIAELIHYEDLGFSQKGEGGRMIDEGETGMNGRIPFSPSGGLLSRGHPTGATGTAQVVESVRQIRGIHENQVEGARVGMTHCMGGFQDTLEASEAAVSTVTILKRGW
jgi:acetyl-CoA acetyltransferase